MNQPPGQTISRRGRVPRLRRSYFFDSLSPLSRAELLPAAASRLQTCVDTNGCAPMEENSMPTYRFPALVWEDHTGHFTAALVEHEGAPAGFAITASDALHQLKEYLDLTSQRYFWRPGPDFMDAKLLHIRVEIRPEYKAANRVYPSDEIFPLRLPVVYGRNSSDTFVCSIPTLNIRFIFH